MNKYQIIFSKRIMLALIERGFIPQQTIPNPQFPQFNCWLFENSEEFQKAAKEVFGNGE